MIAEPDVALSDWGLALECAILSRLVARGGPKVPARAWLVLFFASTGLAALVGGAVHGFFPDPAGPGQPALWALAVLVVGVTAWAGWALGAHLAFGTAIGRRAATAAGLEFIAYALVAWRAGFHFAIAVANYLPPAAFLLGVFVRLAARHRDGRLGAGIAGLVLTFLAAVVQHAGTGPIPVPLDRNTAYHVIQAVALLLIHRGAAAALAIEGGR